MNQKIKSKYKYLYINEDVHKGLLCIINTNIPLYIILEDISKGYSISEIIVSHPTLTKEIILNAMDEIAQDYSRSYSLL